MTSTKFNPRIYWTYEDTEVFEVSYQAVMDIASANPCFAFQSQIDKLEVGSYLLVAMCWAEGGYAISMGDAFANNYDAAQDYWKMATAGNYLNFVCDVRNCYVCEYEIWHVVDDPSDDKTELGPVYQEYELDALLGGFDQEYELDAISGNDVLDLDNALELFNTGYQIGRMAVLEALCDDN